MRLINKVLNKSLIPYITLSCKKLHKGAQCFWLVRAFIKFVGGARTSKQQFVVVLHLALEVDKQSAQKTFGVLYKIKQVLPNSKNSFSWVGVRSVHSAALQQNNCRICGLRLPNLLFCHCEVVRIAKLLFISMLNFELVK